MSEKPYDAAITQVMDIIGADLDDRFNTFRASTNTVIRNHADRIETLTSSLKQNTDDTRLIKDKVTMIENQVATGFEDIKRAIAERKSRDRTKLLVLTTALGFLPTVGTIIAIYRTFS